MTYNFIKIAANYIIGACLTCGFMMIPIPLVKPTPFYYIALVSITWPAGIALLYGVDTATELLCK